MSDIHSCSYYCDRPECTKAQRDELRAKYVKLEDQHNSLVRQLTDATNLASDPSGLRLRTASHVPDDVNPEALETIEIELPEHPAVSDFKHRLAEAIEKMPFGDTAASFAAFVREFK